MAASSSLHWYQVVLTDGMSGPDLRARVQAATPDAALRHVMRVYCLSYAVSASIWRLGDRGRVGAPVVRHDVCVRLPRQPEVTR